MQKISIIIFIMLFFNTGCKQKANINQDAKKENCIINPELKAKLTFDTIQIKNASIQTELTGKVSFDLDRIFRYQSLFSGVVQQVYFNIGDYVEKGQLLAEIRSANLSEQKNNLTIAESALEIAERDYKSIKNMHRSQLASDREVLEAEKKVLNLLSEINKIKESLHIQGGNIEKGAHLVRAAQSGYIVMKNITSGSSISEGDQDLFAISDLKKIWVMVNVYAAQLNAVQQGERAVVHTTAYPNKQFEGTITRLSNVFDPEEKVMKAVIEMDNSDLKLKPDMMVSVSVFQDSKQEALAIPVQNVIFDNDAYHVILYTDDCDVSSIKIEPTGKDKNYYYLPKNTNLLDENKILVSQNNLLLYNKLIGR